MRLLQDNPKLATELYCGLLGRRLPDYTSVKEGSEAMTRNDKPDKRDCDNLEVYYQDEKAVFALIVEVQLRPSDEKHYSWPDYLIAVRSRLRCPVALVVICPDAATTKWAGLPIETGHMGFTLVPFVIGPDLIPVVTDPDEVRGCEQMALLSAMTHGDGEKGHDVMAAFGGAIANLPKHLQVKYTRIASNTLTDTALGRLEAIMTDTVYRRNSGNSIFHRFEAEGEARGEANMLLRILDRRGIAVDAAARDRIASCTEIDQLERWGDRALEIERVEELFD
ncbi:hypothetical protein [Glycomyces arizonensis]|uniref:hypothetical protein n=1 Tax=Glycomyces arizonensis TaxID=256035 RepID=UPI000424562A|nr:hypothetical protein [Glycomyces arizonensis]